MADVPRNDKDFEDLRGTVLLSGYGDIQHRLAKRPSMVISPWESLLQERSLQRSCRHRTVSRRERVKNEMLRLCGE